MPVTDERRGNTDSLTIGSNSRGGPGRRNTYFPSLCKNIPGAVPLLFFNINSFDVSDISKVLTNSFEGGQMISKSLILLFGILNIVRSEIKDVRLLLEKLFDNLQKMVYKIHRL